MEEGKGMRAYFANVLTIVLGDVVEVVLLWWSAPWGWSRSMSS